MIGHTWTSGAVDGPVWTPLGVLIVVVVVVGSTAININHLDIVANVFALI